MDFIHVERNGKPDLVFQGRLVAAVDERQYGRSGKAKTGQGGSFWEIALFETSVGKYIMASAFHIAEPVRRTMRTALAFNTADDIHDYLGADSLEAGGLGEALMRQAGMLDEIVFTAPEALRATA